MIVIKHNVTLQVNSIVLTAVLLVTLISTSAGVPTTASTASTDVPTTTSPYENPLVEHKHERNCKALCEHCGCLGFYCGEECICECNNENSDTECIHTMQVNARTLNTPFEILIQGPSSNRFVRNAQQFEQPPALETRSVVDAKATRSRRSTITIYKPLASGIKRAALSVNAVEPPLKSVKERELARHKRSVEHLEWFNDFAGSLVRPSPLGTRGQKQREAKPTPFKRQADAPDDVSRRHREPWFLEQSAPFLNRPAPLYKRQQLTDESERRKTSKSGSTRNIRPDSMEDEFDTEAEADKSNKDIRPLRDALQVVERIPRVLQDTVTHLAADDNSGDVFSLNIMNDVLPKKIPRKDRVRAARRRLRQKQRAVETEPKPTVTVKPTVAAPVPPFAPLVPLASLRPLAPRGLFLPWLRQQRLNRLQGDQ